MSKKYEDSVFINCPFDKHYESLFNAIIFAIHDCGFVARCALEINNAASNRLGKIMKIISECKYGVHDISRTGLNYKTRLPRFNMPLELGIFLGCTQFGLKEHKKKVSLIMDKDKYRYQKFISDISGQDIVSHDSIPKKAIQHVRGWLKTESRRENIPGGTKIYSRYSKFQKELPLICKERHIKLNELTFIDFSEAITIWLKENSL